MSVFETSFLGQSLPDPGQGVYVLARIQLPHLLRVDVINAHRVQPLPARVGSPRRSGVVVGSPDALKETHLHEAMIRIVSPQRGHKMELPTELLADVRARKPMSSPPVRAHGHGSGRIATGQRVRHTKFGEGVVLHLEGLGEHGRIQVNFERGRDRVAGGGYAGLWAV